MRLDIRILVPTLVIATAAGAAPAQEWQHTLTPYLWMSGMSGKTAIGTALGPVEADVDVGFGDILKNLKIGGMVAYRGDRGPWTVMADAIYMNLEADKASSVGPVRLDATAEVKQTALEADLGYRLAEHTVAFVGLRYNEIDADLSLVRSGPGAGANRSAGRSESWTDPVIGVVTQLPLNERWSLGLRGDLAGFGVGSDLTWQAMATVHWKASDTLEVVGGYRYLDADYENGSGASLFKYDMVTSGPGLGVSFKF
jgi:hypothetical protein